jgi:hypothetical protein
MRTIPSLHSNPHHGLAPVTDKKVIPLILREALPSSLGSTIKIIRVPRRGGFKGGNHDFLSRRHVF